MTQQSYPIKCRIQDEAGVTRIDVYDDIGEGGFFGGGLSAKEFAGQMAKTKGAISVHVNSSGGDVFDGISIGNTLRSHKGPVTIVVDGLAASIASVIAQAGQERIAQPGAMYMIHDAFGACLGNSAEMSKMAQTLDQVSDNIADIYAASSGRGSADTWRDAMKEETWYTADEAVAAGLADRVGDGEAQLPAGLDLAAFTALPGRIAAALRSLPQAPADSTAPDLSAADGEPPKCKTCGGTGRLKHPVTGKGSGNCPSCGGTGTYEPPGDEGDEGQEPDVQDAASESGTEKCKTCGGKGTILDGHRECPDCDGTGKVPAGTQDHGPQFRDAQMHGDHERVDPDGDGDCDACPEGDTDHDYWSAAGKQIKSLPGKPVPDALTETEIRAIIREELRDAVRGELQELQAAASVDNSDWDASKAWHNGTEADDPAAFYAGICAGEKTSGDPATQAHWALPYRYTPSSPPNAAGVRNSLARLSQTQDLKDADGARKKLEQLMKQINPDYEPPDDHTRLGPLRDGPGLGQSR